MKRRFLLIIAIAAIPFQLFAQTNCANLQAEVSMDGKYIYFSSNRAGNYDIYRCLSDGSGLEQLTSTAAEESNPAVSPDGSKVLYQLGSYGSAQVWVMNADGTEPARVSSGSRHRGFPNWSPDASKIVCEGWDDYNYPEIYIMDSDGSNEVKLTDDPGAFWNSAPQFNPSGSRIYFQKAYNADNYYVSMNPDGTDLDTITKPNSFGFAEFGLSFSKDGQKIIFSTTEYRKAVGNEGSDVIIANADGSDWTRVTQSTSNEYFYIPAFFKDTSSFLCSHTLSSASGNWQIIEYVRMDDTWAELTNCFNIGIQEVAGNFKVYPNPATSEWNITLAQPGSIGSVELISMEGRILHSWFVQSEDNSVTLTVPDVANGLYYLLIRSGGNRIMHPVSVVR
ncbi:MAG: PD40 domain-containing protein [Flavobacteriales bacterium]|nr:PD40 domain-containing protein [Flavobacteriales bacterium]